MSPLKMEVYLLPISLRKVNRVLLRLCKAALIVMIPLMTVVIFAQVVLRYAFLSPLSWPEELARYLLIWVSCLGAAYALQEGLHISIEFLKRRLSGAIRLVGIVVIHSSLLAFFAFCAVEGVIYAISEWGQLTTAMRIPMTFPIMAIPIGCGIMFMVGLENLAQDLRGSYSGRDNREGGRKPRA